MLRFGLAIAYIIGQWRLYYNADVDAKATKREVLIFSSIYSIYLLLQCRIVLAIILNSSQEAYIHKSMDKLVWVSFCFLLFSLWFMLDGNTKSKLYYLK
jgi:hypothetical protein